MLTQDDLIIERLLLGGSIRLAEAAGMQRTSPIQRDIADSFLKTLCLPALGEGTPGNFGYRFPFYLRWIVDDPTSLEAVPGPVADAFLWASTQEFHGRAMMGEGVRERLVPDAHSDRERGLAIHTRVFATRIRDGVMHPFIGVDQIALPDVYDYDRRCPEVLAIQNSALLRDSWLRSRDTRGSVEEAVLALAASVAWG